eukprot:433423-Rhodomonas_salina.2
MDGPAVEREDATPEHEGEGPNEWERELEDEGRHRAPIEEATRCHEVCAETSEHTQRVSGSPAANLETKHKCRGRCLCRNWRCSDMC